MAYRPLDEFDETTRTGGELWQTLTRKINDALNYLHGLASNILGVEKSIEKNSTTKKISLKNDKTDTELEAEGKDLVYGWSDSEGRKGWGEIVSGYVGTKEVDESNLANDKTLVYDATKGMYVLKTYQTSTTVQSKAFFTLPYKLWRESLGSVFTGYMDVQIQISTDYTFSTTTVDVKSEGNTDDFLFFSAANNNYQPWQATGIPATDVMDIIYTGNLTFTSKVYLRWRTYEHDTSNYGAWIPGGLQG